MVQILKIISGNEKDLPNKGTYMVKINVLEVASTIFHEDKSLIDYEGTNEINLYPRAFKISKALMNFWNAFIDGFKD